MKKICEEFNKIDLHDSKLIAIRIQTGEKPFDNYTYNISMELRIIEYVNDTEYRYSNTILTFTDCRHVILDMDIIGKEQASNQIGSNYCKDKSELLDNIIKSYADYDPYALGNHHFYIDLIPPTGSIEIIARDFKLELFE